MGSTTEAMLLIREIAEGDFEAIAHLSGELGYPVTAHQMKSRIASIENIKDHSVFVACYSGAVTGWIEVFITHHLTAGIQAEIGGLVVSEKHRNHGIGKELLARAESWAQSKGLTNMIVRSRITREAAHRFYRREGYELIKTSAVFSKTLE